VTSLFYFDTETFLLSPGAGAPPMVCLQFAVDDGAPQVIHAKDPVLEETVRWALTQAQLVGHVLEYDMAVVAAWAFKLDQAFGEEILELVFRAYWEDRATDTSIRQKLLDIAHGCFEGDRFRTWGYSLGEISDRVCGIKLDKTDPWRMLYGTLYATPVAQWPEEAIRYCHGDVIAPRTIYQAQEPHRDLLQDQFRQARYAFAKRLMECWGIRTDREAVEKFHAQTLAESEVDRTTAVQAGLVRPDGSRNMKAAKGRMVQVFHQLEEEPALTDTGREVQDKLFKDTGRKFSAFEIWDLHGDYIALDEDACLASGDDILQAFQRYGSLKTTLSRVERLYYGTEVPLQASFQSIVATGRTSCRMGDVEEGVSPPSWGFQLQNIPRKEGLRECFIPRPGFWFSSVDYDSQELKSWAQVCIWTVGHSRLAQVLNDGLDPHTELGASVAGISKEEAYAKRKAGDKPFNDGPRQVAKIGNFGYQGGMGPATLRIQARKEYRVFLALRQCQELRDKWRKEWPESVAYFAWVNSLLAGGETATVRHFLSDRVRGNIPYTVTCNTFFQGLTADAAKAAGFRLAWECYVDKSSPLYGSRVVDFIHDEYLLEVPEGERGHHAAYRQAEIMREEAQKWHPDVRITCSPAVMTRWRKNAKAVHTADGMLVPEELARA
jgi:DNA polymerase-1